MISGVRTAAIAFLLIFAVTSDLKSRRIPNRLTIPFVIMGLILNTAIDFPGGFTVGLLGCLAGFLIFMLPYIMKAMGAGDVKLMAALGALTDWRTVVYIAVFTALSGGIIVIAKKLVSGGFVRTLKRTGKLLAFYFYSMLTLIFPIPTMEQRKEKYRVDTSDKKNDFIPYAVAIAAGTVITLILSRTGSIQGLSI